MDNDKGKRRLHHERSLEALATPEQKRAIWRGRRKADEDLRSMVTWSRHGFMSGITDDHRDEGE